VVTDGKFLPVIGGTLHIKGIKHKEHLGSGFLQEGQFDTFCF